MQKDDAHVPCEYVDGIKIEERPPEWGQSRGIQMDPDAAPTDTAIVRDTLHKGEFDHDHHALAQLKGSGYHTNQARLS
jgi:hypothetical protein